MGTGNRLRGDNQPHYRILQHSEYLLWDRGDGGGGGGGGALRLTTLFGACRVFSPVSLSGRRGDDRTNILEPREDIGLVYGWG